ncbi:MAG: hypothetical protein HY910_06400 [Desulfarculus sp.]|nr:hypothetical protein [Desulfarculus sp.]
MDKRLLRYLQIASPSLAEQEAGQLWDEAQGLVDLATWQDCLDLPDFYRRFHPYAANSAALGRLLAPCRQVRLLVATLGDRLERRARDYLDQQEAFRGYVLDRLGSYLVEQRMRGLDRQVTLAAQVGGCSTTRRYSPGYRDFALDANRVFVELASSGIPGLELGEGGLLRPEKTITALKGLTQHAGDKP